VFRNLPAEQPVAVIKIGGSILTSAKAYHRAAIFVRNHHPAAPEERLVVVVFAQEGATDYLEQMARKIVPEPHAQAHDLLWSTGELRSVALLALHLQALGISAAVLNVHEAGLRVSGESEDGVREFAHASLNARCIRGALERHPVAVVPGFFASDEAEAIVSLGRGGSDLTAVLLAEGLRACRCELRKDDPGYFPSDPHRDPSARHLPSLIYEEALALADGECDLVQPKAIVAAARTGLPLVICSLEESEKIRPQQLGQLPGIDAVTLAACFPISIPAGITHHELRDLRLQQVVQPGSPSAFFKTDVQAPAEPLDKLKNRNGFGFDDAFHHQLARRVQDRDRDRFLVHIHPDIGYSFRFQGFRR
jgi:aspartokinase